MVTKDLKKRLEEFNECTFDNIYKTITHLGVWDEKSAADAIAVLLFVNDVKEFLVELKKELIND